MKNNICELVNNHLCVQCGTCEAICPANAIKIFEFKKTGLLYPQVDDQVCINCGLCVKVCPVDDYSIHTEILSSFDSAGIYDVILDDDPNRISSSGGAVTAILRFLFQKKLITKAITSVINGNGDLAPHPVVISDEVDLEKTRGSIYQPVPVNQILKRIIRDDKLAVVGLPCHIRGVDNYFKNNKDLKENIQFKIGIFCNIGRSKNATRLLIDIYGKKNKKLLNLHYRMGDYPGNLTMDYGNESVSVPYREYMTRTAYFFTPRGCLFCDDLFNEWADISIGDPWGSVQKKQALIIARNDRSSKLIGEMLSAKYISLDRKLSDEEILRTQNVEFKQNRALRARIYKKFGINIPKKMGGEIVSTTFQKMAFSTLIINLFLIISSFIFNSRLYFLAKLFPYKFLNALALRVKKTYKKSNNE